MTSQEINLGGKFIAVYMITIYVSLMSSCQVIPENSNKMINQNKNTIRKEIEKPSEKITTPPGNYKSINSLVLVRGNKFNSEYVHIGSGIVIETVTKKTEDITF